MKQGKESDRGLRIAAGTGEEIRAEVSDNTLKAYEHATRKLEAWLEGRGLTDAVLAEYIRFLHAEGKSPATINLVVSAVKWMAEYRGIDTVVGDITARTLSEIRGEGKERGRRQVDGLTWDDVERVCTAAEASDTAADGGSWRGGIDRWPLASYRVCGVACRRRGNNERGATGGALAESGDAGAVCEGGTGGTKPSGEV